MKKIYLLFTMLAAFYLAKAQLPIPNPPIPSQNKISEASISDIALTVYTYNPSTGFYDLPLSGDLDLTCTKTTVVCSVQIFKNQDYSISTGNASVSIIGWYNDDLQFLIGTINIDTWNATSSDGSGFYAGAETVAGRFDIDARILQGGQNGLIIARVNEQLSNGKYKYYYNFGDYGLEGAECTGTLNCPPPPPPPPPRPIVGDACSRPADNSQTICGDQCIIIGTYPLKIVGSQDGKEFNIHYDWYSSNDLKIWSEIPYANDLDYESPILTKTTYFKRVTTYFTNKPKPSATSNIITVFVGTPPPLTISSSGNLTGCANQESISLISPYIANNQWYFSPAGSGGLQIKLANSYITSGGATIGEIVGTASQVLQVWHEDLNANGNYWVVNNNPGCAVSTSNQIPVALKTSPTRPVITGTNYVCPPGTVTLTANALKPTLTRWYAKQVFGGWSYNVPKYPIWVNLNGSIGVTGNTYSHATPGTYYVQEVYPNGCSINSADFTVTISQNCQPYREGYFDDNTNGDYTISPNPANEILTVGLVSSVPTQIQIISTNGVIVKEFSMNEISKELNISDLASGLYLMNINQNGVTTRKKFQVIK